MACASLIKAIELKPDWGYAYRLLAMNLTRLGRRDEALTAALNAAELAPHSSEAWCALGDACSAVGKTEQAISAFHEAHRRVNPGWGKSLRFPE